MIPRRHDGGDIYVLGSGPSLRFIPPRFFDGKVVISTNHGCTMMGIQPTYLVTKYHQHAREYAGWFPGIPIYVTKHDRGDTSSDPIEVGPWTILDHDHNQDTHWDGVMPDDGKVLATHSTIATAMHVAALLGAANIILAGHDCGFIDGSGRVDGYGSGRNEDHVLWASFNRQSMLVKRALMNRYGCTVTSVNPFINFHLEGHQFKGV